MGGIYIQEKFLLFPSATEQFESLGVELRIIRNYTLSFNTIGCLKL